LKAICRALNIIFWKVPSVTGSAPHTNKDGQWWAAELQDKGIKIEWDEESEEFIPSARRGKGVA